MTAAIQHYSRTGVRSAKPITTQWLASEGVAIANADVLMAKQLMRRVDALIHNSDPVSVQKILLWHEERGRKEGLSKEMQSAIDYAKGRLSFVDQKYLGSLSNMGHSFWGSPYMNLKWQVHRRRLGIINPARFARNVSREVGGLIPAIRSWRARP
jgi:hypothetical protein